MPLPNPFPSHSGSKDDIWRDRRGGVEQGSAPTEDCNDSPLAPGHAGDNADLPKAKMIFPPWIEPMRESSNFYAGDFHLAIPAVVGAEVSSAALQFRPPSGQIGYVQNLTQYILTPTAGVELFWSLRIAGGPISGFDRLLNPPLQSRALYIPLSDLRVPIPDGSLVQLWVTNISGVACTAGGEFSGWYHSKLAEELYWGKG